MAAHHHYGRESTRRLKSCHPALFSLMNLALKNSPVDITIIHGYRTNEEQNEIFRQGFSKKRGGESVHNNTSDNGEPLSLGVDFAPYVNGGIDWSDSHMFAVVAGVILAAAEQLELEIRWGGDWDMDGSTKDQTFMDWGHIELVANAT